MLSIEKRELWPFTKRKKIKGYILLCCHSTLTNLQNCTEIGLIGALPCTRENNVTLAPQSPLRPNYFYYRIVIKKYWKVRFLTTKQNVIQWVLLMDSETVRLYLVFKTPSNWRKNNIWQNDYYFSSLRRIQTRNTNPSYLEFSDSPYKQENL